MCVCVRGRGEGDLFGARLERPFWCVCVNRKRVCMCARVLSLLLLLVSLLLLLFITNNIIIIILCLIIFCLQFGAGAALYGEYACVCEELACAC